MINLRNQCSCPNYSKTDDKVPKLVASTPQALPKARKKSFDLVSFLVVRSLWQERNVRVFRNVALLPNLLVDSIGSQWEQWSHAELIEVGCLRRVGLLFRAHVCWLSEPVIQFSISLLI
jgi:hypothetical protein